MAQYHPQTIDMFKTSRQHRRRNNEQAGNDQGPESGTLSVDKGPQSDDCEDAPDQKPEVALLFCFTLHAQFLSLHSSSSLNITIRRSAHPLCLKLDAGACIISST